MTMKIYKPTADERRALQDFRERALGRGWKVALSRAWMTGVYPSSLDARYVTLLQGLRNTQGPTWLTRFTLS